MPLTSQDMLPGNIITPSLTVRGNVSCDSGGCEFQPLTIPERLDAATDGQQFAAVLGRLFGAMERARDEEDEP